MKPYHILVGLTPFLLSCEVALESRPTQPPSIEVGFSPTATGEMGCTDRIIRRIGSARKSIYVQAYSFTSSEIGTALVKAHHSNPNLKIQIILDKSNQSGKHSLLGQMLEAKIPVLIDSSHAIAHNKVMIFDEEEVETGSFNFTHAAQHRNAENCIFIKDKNLAQRYIDNWQRHQEHSEIIYGH